MISSLLTNRTIESFEILENDFCAIGISNGYGLTCESLLRYVGNDGTFITNQDHGHRFGLPEPTDAANKIAIRIVGQSIQSVKVESDTGDLTLYLSDRRLELISSSAGYENYQLNGTSGFILVGRGGKEPATI